MPSYVDRLDNLPAASKALLEGVTKRSATSLLSASYPDGDEMREAVNAGITRTSIVEWSTVREQKKRR